MSSSDNSSSEIPVIKDSTIADMEEQRKRAAIRFLTNIPMDLKSFYQMHKERMLEKSDNSMGPKQLTWPKNTSSEKGVFQEGEGPVNNAKSMPPWPQKINQKSAFRIKHLKAKVLLQKRIFIVDKAGNVPLLAYSVLPYKKEGRAIISNAVNMGGRRRSKRTSGSRPMSVMSGDLLYEATLSIDGIQLPGKEEEVSYNSLLEEQSNISSFLAASSELENPEWKSGSHRTVLTFPGYMVSIIDYAKPTELKKDLNDRFREKYPKVNITLSKCRSLKQVMQRISLSQNIDRFATEHALAYFDYLVMSGKVIKDNRRHCAGACLLLSAKVNSDLRSMEISRLISGIEHGLKISRHDLVQFEFPVFAALQFSLVHFT